MKKPYYCYYGKRGLIYVKRVINNIKTKLVFSVFRIVHPFDSGYLLIENGNKIYCGEEDNPFDILENWFNKNDDNLSFIHEGKVYRKEFRETNMEKLINAPKWWT